MAVPPSGEMLWLGRADGMGGRRLALVVAVDNYDVGGLQQLTSPAADADALAEVLGDPGLGGFEMDILHNPTSSATCERIERLLAERSPADLVLLHFSCHGLKDESGELYLAVANTRPDLLASTAVDAGWINRVMQRSRAERVVLLLDCCYGGAFERGVVARSGGAVDIGDQFGHGHPGEGRGRVVITASTAMEYSFDGAQLAENGRVQPSIFTGALVDGIRTGEADRDQDGHVTLSELYDFVYERVRQRTPNQTPSKWEFGLRGDLYVARNPYRRVRPATLPPELTDLLRHPLPAVRLTAVRELAPLVSGTDLMRATAARLALADMEDDDSRSVSTEAAAVLAETAVRVTPDVVDLGEVAVGAAAVAGEVTVQGSPLALASGVVAGAGLRARIEGETLRIFWSPQSPGELDETVTLEGAAGTARVRVTGRTPVPALPHPAPPESDQPPTESRTWWRSPIREIALALAGAALAGLGIWAAQAWSGENPPADDADYRALLAKLPAAVQGSCTPEQPDEGALAQANCSPGVYTTWRTRAAMDADTGISSSIEGDCTYAPSGARRISSGLPGGAELICDLLQPGSSQRQYVVRWIHDDRLLTGAFFTEPGADSSAYPEIHRQAMTAFEQLP
ncbi:caspase family protein [Actinoplanes sp. NPDC051861]|uniref:caspase family protein n=1 Tax=Actinoplanes sp. NPDC051861 TaxID=3155170 RepID=UPI0034274379